jgi:hypothetical protein
MTQNTQSKGSKATNFGMVAWISYGVLSGYGHWVGAALAALGIAVAIVAHEYSRDAIKILDCVTAAYFGFALVTTIAIGPWLFRNYSIFLSWGVFASVTWATLLVGFPFTIQYAREKAPPEIWNDPLFMRLNLILTAVFGLMFSVNTMLGAIAVMTGHLLFLGLIIPLALLVAAIVFSSVYPKAYAQRVAPEWATAQAAAALGAGET